MRLCGFGPAVFATFASAVIIDRYLIEPQFVWSLAPVDLLRISFFILVSMLISSVAKQKSEVERASEENSSRLAAIVESSEDAIYGKTLEGVVTSWNKGAEQLYGYKAEEILGKNVSLLASPDHPHEVLDILSGLKAGRKIEQRETQRVTKDGSRADVAISISPIYDVEGNVIGAASIARDITARKNAEREINNARLAAAEAEKQRGEILQSIAEGFLVLDRHWTISYIKPRTKALSSQAHLGGTFSGRTCLKSFQM